jgi:eukaryotic-like serine/threonine-protein kinase
MRMAAPEVQPPQASLTGTTVGRFHVGTRLGVGGMGEVYVAEDTTLKRKVALKRVSPALRDDPAHVARMFKEAQRASSLAHPCVASIFDVLQEGGEIFLVMEYVEGVSLRERLKQKPPVDEILRVLEQCAGALKAAHEKNIIHGDVKPENIMITAGRHAKLLDFGVARRIIVDTGQAETTTQLQGWGGTPGYLAPEVLLEQPSDGRADLFSLGVVMYEALTGVQPFRGDSTVSTFDHTLHDDPLALSDVNPALPAELGKIVQKLMAKRPEQRYANAEAVLVDLRPLVAHASSANFTAPVYRRPRAAWTIAIALSMVALAAGTGWWISSLQKTHRAVALPANRYLAVLPFKAAGTNPGDQAFADGITSMLVSNLTRLTLHQPLQIASAADARRVADAQQAHRTLGVNLVLQGKVERSGDNVRVDYSLVDARTLDVLRSDTLLVPGADPFALSDQLTAAATHLLAFDLAPDEQRNLGSHGTQQREAYESYLSGEGYRQQNTAGSIENAIQSLRLATEKDPNYALAWSSLGESYLWKFKITHQAEWLDSARRSCKRATEADSRAATGYVCLGEIETTVGKYDAAVTNYQQALANDSTSDAAYSDLGEAYQRLNRLEDAERNYRHAVEVRPNYWMTHSNLGHFYTIIGRYQDAVTEYMRATELAPDLAPPYWQLAGANIYLGAYDAAIAASTKGISIAPTPQQYSNLGSAYLGLHRYADAITAFEQASRMAGSDYISLGNLARAYTCAGETDRAKPVYRQAIELADSQVKVNPKDGAAHLMLAVYHAAVGDRSQAYKELAAARTLTPDYAELWFFTAIIGVQFGDRAGALKALEHALALGYSRSEVRTAPEFEPLHTNPDFQALARAQ